MGNFCCESLQTRSVQTDLGSSYAVKQNTGIRKSKSPGPWPKDLIYVKYVTAMGSSFLPFSSQHNLYYSMPQPLLFCFNFTSLIFF